LVDFLVENFGMVVKIRSIDQGPYIGFQVDGNMRFLLGDFTATTCNVWPAPIVRTPIYRFLSVNDKSTA
jgi:hypothetical protein